MNMGMESTYTPPLALTIVSSTFLLLGALSSAVVAADIFWRRGWRSMMLIMIPVYIINATYIAPVTLWVYFKYGRPSKPTKCNKTQNTVENAHAAHACHVGVAAQLNDKTADSIDSATASTAVNTTRSGTCCGSSEIPSQLATEQNSSTGHRNGTRSSVGSSAPTSESRNDFSANADDTDAVEKGQGSLTTNPKTTPEEPHCHHHGSSRPMYATVLAGVSHCGAGCVLGDIVGEWLVYGTGATINGQSIWVELLVDYAFALLFGIAFQYFSIAAMRKQYGLGVVWDAAKADILSLTSFEVGAFGWMIVYQVGIWDYRLSMMTWTYWWMMQVGMVFGFATAVPVNWWLLTKGVKEPCC